MYGSRERFVFSTMTGRGNSISMDERSFVGGDRHYPGVLDSAAHKGHGWRSGRTSRLFDLLLGRMSVWCEMFEMFSVL